MKEFTSCLGALLLVVGVMVYGVVVGGWAVDRFYYWFLLPVFPTAPLITFSQAIGISFILLLFKNHQVESKNPYESESDKNTRIYGGLFIYPVIVFLGWIVHLIIH